MSSNSKQRQTFNSPGDLHELTWCCYRWQPFLRSERAKTWLATALDRHRTAFRFQLTAFVFMPEHVHLLIRPLQPLYDVTRIRAAIKRSVTKAAVSHLKVAHPRRLAAMEAAAGVYRFWQDGPGYDRNLRTETAIRSSIEYLHANPVRRRLCETILDYEWSSARAYHGWPSQLDVDIWKPGG